PFALNVVTKRVIYVDSTATGTPVDGTTWGNAFRSINDALVDWSAGAEIWVANKATLTLSTPLTLEEGTKLYGGFLGTENTPEQRLPLAQTTLEGIQSLSAFIDQPGAPLTRATLIDGFTFRSRGDGRGLILPGASPTIRNSSFTNFRWYAIDNDHA